MPPLHRRSCSAWPPPAPSRTARSASSSSSSRSGRCSTAAATSCSPSCEQDFVDRLGWLTQQQLLDAVAVGQFTPGPVFTTATFVGYLVGGWPGAVLATVGIFLPAFLFVALTDPLLPRLRRSPWAAAFLDGVNVAAVGLMAAVAWTLGRAAVVDLPTALLALAATAVLLRFKLNSAWLILAGGAIGVLVRGLAG